jgi:acyl-CoA thioester hydrolase
MAAESLRQRAIALAQTFHIVRPPAVEGAGGTCSFEMPPLTHFPDHCKTTSLVRVRFCDTDMMGVVHHSNYIKYFELARIEYLRRRGLNYVSWTNLGLHLPVIGLQADYRKPAYLDDLLRVEARLSFLSRVRVGFDYQVFRPSLETDEVSLIATGSTMLACVDNKHAPVRMSRDAEQLLLSAETIPGEVHL